MIWIWLATRHRHKWGTGPLDRYFTFLCAHCGLSMAAMVRTFGFGSGSSPMAAERSAHAAADANAHRTVSAAGCPGCSRLQPAIHDQFERAGKKAAWRQSMRLPFALVAAVLSAIALAIPAVRDLRHSVMLAVVAISASAAAGALVFALFSRLVTTPFTNPAGVWFSRDPAQGSASWFPAQPGPVPVVAQPTSISRVISLVTLGVTGLSAIVALVLWTETFRKVYVVSAEGPGRSLTVRIDGQDAGALTQGSGDDAPNTTFEVRTSSAHHVVVVDRDGRELSYDLDPATAKYGWALAPHARERGLCLASIKFYYGTTPPKDGDDALLGDGEDLVALPHSFDHVYTPPPPTVETQNGASTTRTSLRALDCASLDHELIVPFKEKRWSR